MYKFEKILKDNEIAETNSEIPQTIIQQINKFRRLQQIIKDSPEDIAGNEEREGQLSAIDEKIMQTLPDFFDVEDEEEENEKAAQQKKEAEKGEIAKKEAEKKEAEKLESESKARAAEEELNTPAKTNPEALEKLFKQGKEKVTISELKKAGFDTGWFGPIGLHGCTCGNYSIYRENSNSGTFELFKKK